MNQEKIGQFIAKCRKEQKLTQIELAQKLGVSDKSVSKWENAKCMPDLSLFAPLCEILNITINDLMAGEKVDDKEYIGTLEKNIINMVSDAEKRKKKKKRIIIIISIIILTFFLIFQSIYRYYEIDVRYDKRVMSCEITDNQLYFYIKGQSVLNTYHTSRNIDGKIIYFFHSTINIYNKSRSNWEYSQSMARLLENKNLQFGFVEWLDIDSKNVEVYYTDKSIRQIEKLPEQELKDMIEKSYLMCKSNN